MSTTTRGEQQPNDERLRLEFNDWALTGKGPSMEKGHRPIGEQAIELMGIPANARVLDVGCGSGWATRLMSKQTPQGSAVGIDISDEMIRLASEASRSFPNIEFRVASAEKLPFQDGEFTHAFSMESLYYYADMLGALKEVRRVLEPGGLFVTVVDLYQENRPSHQWINKLNLPVQLLSSAEYRSLFERANFINVRAQRLYDPLPVPEDYSGGTFQTRQDYIEYKESGSLMLAGEVAE
jgi:ubiquinone/menaquinone biosynthesis C-methylase UbiE